MDLFVLFLTVFCPYDSADCKVLSESSLHWRIVAAIFHVTHTFLYVCVSGVWVFVTQDATHFYQLTQVHFLTIHTSGVAQTEWGRIEKVVSCGVLICSLLGLSTSPQICPTIPLFVSIYCPLSLLFYIRVPFSVCFCLASYSLTLTHSPCIQTHTHPIVISDTFLYRFTPLNT